MINLTSWRGFALKDTFSYKRHYKGQMAKHNTVGKIGEEIASIFLKKKGFVVVEVNYLKKYGEIDIIARRSSKYHFIEVKTVSCENIEDVSRESVRPEDNVTREKLRKLKNVIWAYICENHIDKWSFDVCSVFLCEKEKKSKIRFLENQILPE